MVVECEFIKICKCEFTKMCKFSKYIEISNGK